MSDVPEPAIRVGVVDGEAAVRLAAGELEATFLVGLGMLGTSLRHRGEELLALPGGVAGYRDRNVTGLPLLAPWANRLPSWRYRDAGVEVHLDGLDLATDPAGLGLTTDEFVRAVLHAPTTRPDRYTVLEERDLDEAGVRREVDAFTTAVAALL